MLYIFYSSIIHLSHIIIYNKMSKLSNGRPSRMKNSHHTKRESCSPLYISNNKETVIVKRREASGLVHIKMNQFLPKSEEDWWVKNINLMRATKKINKWWQYCNSKNNNKSNKKEFYQNLKLFEIGMSFHKAEGIKYTLLQTWV